MKYKIMDGNEACSHVSYNFTDVAGIYPITPSSTMAELTDSWASDNKLNYFNSPVKVTQMQSEAGAAGMIHGSLQSGCLTTTYTASQGLLLMIPNMYKIAGELLPCVINVAARSIATHALSILGDHQDIYATRMTGFAHLASSSVQQVMDLTGVAHLSTIKGRVPFINFFDGFRTSHELQKIRVIDTDKLKDLIDQKSLQEFRERALNPNNPVTRGATQNDDIYFQMTEVRNRYYEQIPDIVNDYMQEINAITNENYKPFNYYGNKNAKRVIVAMGSVCETIKETIDILNEDIGLIEVHLYRPFSSKYFLQELPETVEKIAVLDRTKEPGSLGEPLYLDVAGIINQTQKDILVVGGRYGLSSKNTTPNDIAGVYKFLEEDNPHHDFTISITDDLTNKSIDSVPINKTMSSTEFLIYGYGSDGMVSASKDVMKITGKNTKAFVQGYFQYDSKKSGGTTISHLRFSNNLIRSTYYIESPSLVMCTKESYLSNYRMLDGIKENGIFILNTPKSKDEILESLTVHDRNILIERNIKFYIIDARSISDEVGLDRRISTIMETVLFKVGKIIDFDFAVDQIKKDAEKKFGIKGSEVVTKNIEAIDKTVEKIELVELPNSIIKENKKADNAGVFEIISSGRGNSLSVSEFIEYEDGTFPAGLSSLEKRNISEIGPAFHKENCIQCNMCSFVCPHAVIRPFLLNEEEVNNAPESLKADLMDANIKGEDLKYTIGVSLPDCTGCRLCVNICPGKKGEKALTMESIQRLKEEKGEAYEYLFKNVTEKRVMPITTVKGSQFVKPKFEFPGACAGCGETSYLKLITQLFGDNMVISNATGCSSIYSSTLPTTAYKVPWANSLFEDNAEYGYGMKIADNAMKERIFSLIESNLDKVDESQTEIYNNYLNDFNIENSEELYNIIDETKIEELKQLKNFIKKKSFWMIGGDGWAYDIGFSGIDHVLANNEDVNILVLDTEVYSNTGGQSSKSSNVGSIAKFTAKGKEVVKKDLAKIALTYPHVYVGSISLGANLQHTVNILKEAENYDGPSIVFAYSPCIAQGIVAGMASSIQEEKKAVETGYYPLFHYNPETKKFKLDAKPDFARYYEFIAGENRYRMLKKINPDKYHELLERNRNNAIERYNYYLTLQEQSIEREKEEAE